MENKLISIYLTVCDIYRTTLAWEVQRFSNNFCPEFTDEEAITCCIFGILERRLIVKDVHHFIHSYWAEWFPRLPDYKQFNKRITLLAPAFELLAGNLLMQQTVLCYMDFVNHDHTSCRKCTIFVLNPHHMAT